MVKAAATDQADTTTAPQGSISRDSHPPILTTRAAHPVPEVRRVAQAPTHPSSRGRAIPIIRGSSTDPISSLIRPTAASPTTEEADAEEVRRRIISSHHSVVWEGPAEASRAAEVAEDHLPAVAAGVLGPAVVVPEEDETAGGAAAEAGADTVTAETYCRLRPR